jgi:uncharacterized membrane protein
MSQENALQRLELRIAYLLRYGVILAGAFMVVGWALSLLTHGDRLGSFRAYAPVSLPVTWSQAWMDGDWGTVTALAGLGILVLLPVVRVLLTGVLFLKQGDRVLALLAFLVFGVLVASFSLGIDL